MSASQIIMTERQDVSDDCAPLVDGSKLSAAATSTIASSNSASKSSIQSSDVDVFVPRVRRSVSFSGGVRQLLYLAPNEPTQKEIAEICGAAGAGWLAQWGGWHITVGYTCKSETVDGGEALKTAAAATAEGWQPTLRGAGRSRRIYGVPVGTWLTALLSNNEALYLTHDISSIRDAAHAVEELGWQRVAVRDFHVTIGPRVELTGSMVRRVAEALVAARWSWVLAIEREPGAGMFVLDWHRARPCAAV